MKRILALFILIAICLISSCDITPPEGNDPVDETKYGYVLPSSAYLGTRLKFFTNDSLPYPIDEYQVLFTGMDEFTHPDSIINDNVYVTLPFGATSGDVYLLHVQYDSSDFVDGQYPLINKDTVFIPPLQVDEISSLKDIRLTWANMNYRINKGHSQYKQGVESAVDIQWHGETRGDTTILFTTYQISDVSYEQYLSFYSIRSDEFLPEFINAYSKSSYTWHGIDVIDYDFFSQGVIKLQDWNPDTLVSGIIITTPGDMNNFYFWCDFSE